MFREYVNEVGELLRIRRITFSFVYLIPPDLCAQASVANEISETDEAALLPIGFYLVNRDGDTVAKGAFARVVEVSTQVHNPVIILRSRMQN